MYQRSNIGPLTLQTFGLMFGARLRRRGHSSSRSGSRSSASRPTGPTRWRSSRWSAGWSARALDFLIQNWDEVSDDLLGNLFSGSGLVWYGGAIGGAIAVLLWARWRGILGLGLLDLAAVPLALGYAIGRIGCQLSGDGDYGEPWDGPWAMAYPDGTVPTDERSTRPRSTRRWRWAWSLVLWRLRDRFRPGHPVRPLPGRRRARALPGRVRPPQRGRRARPDPGAAAQPRDDRSPAAIWIGVVAARGRLHAPTRTALRLAPPDRQAPYARGWSKTSIRRGATMNGSPSR